MSVWLQCLATLQLTLTFICRVYNKCRIRVLVPTVISAGYNMALTPLGSWTPLQWRDRQNGVMLYDAVEHRVSVSEAPTAWKRWQWIGAVGIHGTDYGDFFAELRVERNATLTPSQAIELAYHQTGMWPGPTLTVTKRTGEEVEVSVVTGEPSEAGHRAPRYVDLDYIR
jgi:hypothetical protein